MGICTSIPLLVGFWVVLFFLYRGFSTLALLTVWAVSSFDVGGRPMHCRVLSSIPGPYPLGEPV